MRGRARALPCLLAFLTLLGAMPSFARAQDGGRLPASTDVLATQRPAVQATPLPSAPTPTAPQPAAQAPSPIPAAAQAPAEAPLQTVSFPSPVPVNERNFRSDLIVLPVD